jgi:hypothetical protein
METFNNRLQPFWIFAGKREKALPAMSGFVHPRKRRKSLFDRFLQNRRFRRVDKMRQTVFRLSKIVLLLSDIVYISIRYTSTGCTTFAVGKIHKK